MKKKKRIYKRKQKKSTQNKKRKGLLVGLAVFAVVTSVVFSVVYIVSIYSKSNTTQKDTVNAGSKVELPSIIDVSFKEGATYLGNHCAGVCHMSPKHKGDVLVKYNGDIIVAGDIDANGHHFTNKINKNVSIPAGKYTVKLESFDSYTDRKSASHANQAQEQYYVIFKNGSKTLAKTKPTKDLRDGVDEASDITITNGPNNPIVLNDNANKITIQHAGSLSDGQAGKLSGFEPVCMLLERIDEPKKDKPKKEESNKKESKKRKSSACKSSIGDYVWYDTNGNGIQEDIEEGVEGIKVCAFHGNKRYCDTTNKNGKYRIKNLCKGTYTVIVKGVGAMTQTFDPDGKKDNKTKVKVKNKDEYTKADFGYKGKAPATGLATNVILLISLSVLITIGVLVIVRKRLNLNK